MKQWRQLNSMENTEGLNSILKQETGVFKRPNSVQTNQFIFDKEALKGQNSRPNTMFSQSTVQSVATEPSRIVSDPSTSDDVFQNPEVFENYIA